MGQIKKFLGIGLPVVFLVCFLVILFLFSSTHFFTGHNVLQIREDYYGGEILEGSWQVALSETDSVPVNSSFRIRFGDYEFSEDFVNCLSEEVWSEDFDTGVFYGCGLEFITKRDNFCPSLNFLLEVSYAAQNDTNETVSVLEEVEGEVCSSEDYFMDLEGVEDYTLVGVSMGDEDLSSEVIDLEEIDGQLTVSTDYCESELVIYDVEVNLTELGVAVEEGDVLYLEIYYGDEVLYSASKEIHLIENVSEVSNDSLGVGEEGVNEGGETGSVSEDGDVFIENSSDGSVEGDVEEENVSVENESTSFGAQDFSAQSTTLTQCTNITSSGVYVLGDDVSANYGCMRLLADDVVFDCQGHKITYASTGTGDGIYLNAVDNISVLNCVVEQYDNSYSYSYAFQGASTAHVNLTNNTFFTKQGSSAIYMNYITDSWFYNNNVTTRGTNYPYGIQLVYGNENNYFDSNYVDSNSYAVRLRYSSTNNTFNNTFLTGSGGVEFRDGSEENYFYNASIDVSGIVMTSHYNSQGGFFQNLNVLSGVSLRFDSNAKMEIVDAIINTSDSPISVVSSNAGDHLNLTNVSFVGNDTIEIGDADFTLRVKEYLDVYVKDDADFWSGQSTEVLGSSFYDSGVTDLNGLNRFTLPIYEIEGIGEPVYSNNYTIQVNATGYDSASRDITLTTSDYEYFIFGDEIAPVLDISPDQSYYNFSGDSFSLDVNVTESNFESIVIEWDGVNYTKNYKFGGNSEVDLENPLEGVWLVQFNRTGLAYGNYDYNIFVFDLSGASTASGQRKALRDRGSPLIDYSSNTELHNSYFSQNWAYVDLDIVEDNIAQINYSLYNSTSLVNLTSFSENVTSINFTGLADGEYYYNVSVRDLLNFTNHTETRKITLDGNPPQIEFASNNLENDSYSSSDFLEVYVEGYDFSEANLTFNLYDSSKVPVLSIPLDAGNRFANFTGLADGVYYYDVNMTDLVGFVNVTSRRKITIDTTEPVSSYVSPTRDNSSLVLQNYIYINLSVIDTNPNNQIFYVFNESGEVYSDNLDTPFVNVTGLVDGNYTYYVLINDSASNTNLSLNRSIILDTTVPVTSFDSTYSINDSYYNESSFVAGVSVTDANFLKNNFRIYYSNGSILEDINISGMTYTFDNLVEGVYYYNVTSFDGVNLTDSTDTYKVTVDLTSPEILFSNYSVSNGGVGGSSVLFNFSATDNLAPKVYCYPQYSGHILDIDNRINLTNSSEEEVTKQLPGGENTINVSCMDEAGNLVVSDSISYLVAVINISSPDNYSIVRVGGQTDFVIDEIEGEDFLDNVSLKIFDEGSLFDTLSSFSSGLDSYSFNNYGWASVDPRYLDLTATSFNTVRGQNQNTTDSISLVLLRSEGGTVSPEIQNACPNRTHVVVNSPVLISLAADLDTLVKNYSVVVLNPSLVEEEATFVSSSLDYYEYMNYINYSFVPNQEGEYKIVSKIYDYENQLSEWNYTFYSKASYNTYTINDSSSILIKDLCGGSVLAEGESVSFQVPENATYDVSSNLTNGDFDFDFDLYGVSFNQDVSSIFNYTRVYENATLPEDERNVLVYDFEIPVNYTNYSVTLNYSLIENTLNNESSLKMYKSENYTQGNWTLLDSVVNLNTNTIYFEANDTSRFVLAEDAVATVEVPVSVIVPTSSGGGGSTVKYVDLEVSYSPSHRMELEDQIVIPVTFSNSETGSDISDITLDAKPNTEDLSVDFDYNKIDRISRGQNVSINMVVTSHSEPGSYIIDLSINAERPKLSQKESLYIQLVENLAGGLLNERIVLVEDLFRENPQCLEFNDYLIEAENLMETEPDRAKELVDYAIKGCKDLVTSKGAETQKTYYLNNRFWNLPVLASLIGTVVVLILLTFILRKRIKGKSKKSKKSFFRT